MIFLKYKVLTQLLMKLVLMSLNLMKKNWSLKQLLNKYKKAENLRIKFN